MDTNELILTKFNEFFKTGYISLSQVKQEIKLINNDKKRIGSFLTFLESISHEQDEGVKTFIWNWFTLFYKKIPSAEKKNQSAEVKKMITSLTDTDSKNGWLNLELSDNPELYNQTGVLQADRLFLRPASEIYSGDDYDEKFKAENGECINDEDYDYGEYGYKPGEIDNDSPRDFYNNHAETYRVNRDSTDKDNPIDLEYDFNKSLFRFEAVDKKAGSIIGVIQLEETDSFLNYSLDSGIYMLTAFFYKEYLKTYLPKEALDRLVKAAFNDELIRYKSGVGRDGEPINLYIKKSVPIKMIGVISDGNYLFDLSSTLNMSRKSKITVLGKDFKKKDLYYSYLVNPKYI